MSESRILEFQRVKMSPRLCRWRPTFAVASDLRAVAFSASVGCDSIGHWNQACEDFFSFSQPVALSNLRVVHIANMFQMIVIIMIKFYILHYIIS